MSRPNYYRTRGMSRLIQVGGKSMSRLKYYQTRGMSLLELVLAIAVLVIVFSMVGSMFTISSKQTSRTSQLHIRTEVAERVAGMLKQERFSGTRSGFVYVGNDAISFNQADLGRDAKTGKSEWYRLKYLATTTKSDDEITVIYVTIYPDYPTQNHITAKASESY